MAETRKFGDVDGMDPHDAVARLAEWVVALDGIVTRLCHRVALIESADEYGPPLEVGEEPTRRETSAKALAKAVARWVEQELLSKEHPAADDPGGMEGVTAAMMEALGQQGMFTDPEEDPEKDPLLQGKIILKDAQIDLDVGALDAKEDSPDEKLDS